jgi:hypothetical protein
MALSEQRCLWLAAALDYRGTDGTRLDAAELQLFARYVELSDDSGCSEASNAELVTGLSARRRGCPAHRKAFAGANGARHRLENQHGLISCKRAVRKERAERTGALKVTPWRVTITVHCEHVHSFAWPNAADWIERMFAERALPSHARQIGLRLVRALNVTGTLPATRKELEQLLDVQRGTALKGLRLLEAHGLLSLHEQRDRRPAVFTIIARSEVLRAVATPTVSAPPPALAVTVATVAATTVGAPIAPPPAVVAARRHQVITDAVIGFEPSGQTLLHAKYLAPAVTPLPGNAVAPPYRLVIEQSQFNPEWVALLRAVCLAHRGETLVMLVCPDGTEKTLRTGPGGEPITVSPDNAFTTVVRELQSSDDAGTVEPEVPVAVAAEAEQASDELLPSMTREAMREAATERLQQAQAATESRSQSVQEFMARERERQRRHQRGHDTSESARVVRVELGAARDPVLEAILRSTCADFPGSAPVMVSWQRDGDAPLLGSGGKPITVKPCEALELAVENLRRRYRGTAVAIA